MQYIITNVNWTNTLIDAIENAGPDDVIIVQNDAQLELGERAAARMGRDVTIAIAPQTTEQPAVV